MAAIFLRSPSHKHFMVVANFFPQIILHQKYVAERKRKKHEKVLRFEFHTNV